MSNDGAGMLTAVLLLEMADELFNDISLSDLGHKRQVRDWTIIVKIAGVELRFLQKRRQDGVLL